MPRVPRLIALALLLSASTVRAAGLDETAALRAAIGAETILPHLEALQRIATEHGGNRAAGTAGESATADYLASTLRRAGYAVTEQTFDFPVFRELEPPELAFPDGTRIGGDLRTLVGSAAGTITAPLQPVDFGLPAAGRPVLSTSGCEAEDFKDFPSGAIALIRRGTCPFQVKAEHAAAAGAAGIVFVNAGTENATGPLRARLSSAIPIPAVTLDYATGGRLAEQAAAEPVTVRITVRAESGNRRSRNVIAEYPPSSGVGAGAVLLVGAHYDSVPEGPGINDNGSGVATVLETAIRMAERVPAAAKVRFAFWGAEEIGLVGSRHYAASLSPAELDRIGAALNFDMLGSPNYGRFVYDGDGSTKGKTGPRGSAAIERMLRDYFSALGLPALPTDLYAPSDHIPLLDRGIPAGGLYAGSNEEKTAREATLFGGLVGTAYDPCYHAACDTVANINRQALDELGDAAAHAILSLALSPDLEAEAL